MEMQIFSRLHIKCWNSPWSAVLLRLAQAHDVDGEQVEV